MGENKASFQMDVTGPQALAFLERFERAALGSADAGAKLERQARETKGAFADMGSVAGGDLLARAGTAALQAARDFTTSGVQIYASRVMMRESLDAMLKDARKGEQAMDLIAKASAKPGLTFDSANRGLMQLYPAPGIKNLKTAAHELELFGNAAAINNVRTDEMFESIRQWTQALGRGKVEQEEVNALLERYPTLGEHLVTVFGGRTAEAINKSSKGVADMNAKLIKALELMDRAPDGLANATLNLDNQWKELRGAVGKGLLGDESEKQVNRLAQALRDLKPVVSDVASWLGRRLTQVLTMFSNFADFNRYITPKEAMRFGASNDFSGMVQLAQERKLAAQYGVSAQQDPTQYVTSGLAGGYLGQMMNAQWPEKPAPTPPPPPDPDAAKKAHAAALAKAREALDTESAKRDRWLAEHGGTGAQGSSADRVWDAARAAMGQFNNATVKQCATAVTEIMQRAGLDVQDEAVASDLLRNLHLHGGGRFRELRTGEKIPAGAIVGRGPGDDPFEGGTGGHVMIAGPDGKLYGVPRRGQGFGPQWSPKGGVLPKGYAGFVPTGGGGSSSAYPNEAEYNRLRQNVHDLEDPAKRAQMELEDAKRRLEERDRNTDQYIARLEAALKAWQAGDDRLAQALRAGGWQIGDTIESLQRHLDESVLTRAGRKGRAELDTAAADIIARRKTEADDAAKKAKDEGEERARKQRELMENEIEIARLRAEIASTPVESAYWDEQAIAGQEALAASIRATSGATLEWWQAMAKAKDMKDQLHGRLTMGQEVLAASLGGSAGLQAWLKRKGGGELSMVDAPPDFDWGQLTKGNQTRGDAPDGGLLGILTGGVRAGINDAAPLMFDALRKGSAAGMGDIAGRVAMG